MRSPHQNKRGRSRRSQRGVTLFELLLAVTLLTVFMGMLGIFGNASTQVMVSETVQTDVDTRLRRTMTRMVRELLGSGFDSMTPDPINPSLPQLEYSKSDGVSNGVRVWGEAHRFAVVLENGELDDGVDNNGNGLIDEGQLEWTLGVGGGSERTVVLCSGITELFEGETDNGLDDNGNGLIDEPGLCFERVGEQLVIRLSNARIDKAGNTVTRSLEASLRPRN